MKKLLLMLLCVGLLAAKDDVRAKKPKPRFPLGKETTYVTEPLDADGYIDYVAALNEHWRRGVTPENNANVMLWRAFGPHPEGAKMPADFFKWMKVEPLPENGDYFVPLFQYLRKKLKVDSFKENEVQAIYEELDSCSQRPWKAFQYPNIAGWLKANEKPLALVVKAANCSRYYSPLVPKRTKSGPSPLIGVLLPGVQECRVFANALTARAMLRIEEERFDDAWHDLLACHRLGRLLTHGGTIIELLVGINFDTVAAKADLAFLERADWKAEQIDNCLRDLHHLPRLPLVADKMDLYERFTFLDAVVMMDRYGPEVLEDGPFFGKPSGKKPNLVTKFFRPTIDWEPALRNGNRWYDRIAKAMRGGDRSTRAKQLEQIEKQLHALTKKTRESMPGRIELFLAKGSDKIRGENIGNILLGLMLPAFRKVQNEADRSEEQQHNLYLAFALAAYHRDHSRYPKQLEALKPKYLDKIPTDLFSGKPLIYRPTANGYLLYSVGVNGRDEQGRNSDADPPGDDLTVRMPLPQQKRK